MGEVLPGPRLGLELSCCLQDFEGRRPRAKPLPRNALGQKLSCCLQDCADAVSGPERAAAGGSARRRPGAARDTAANTPGCVTAISAGYPGIPGGIPGPPRFSRGDIQRGVGADSRSRSTPTALAEISMAGRPADNSGTAVRPYRWLSHPTQRDGQAGNLEAAIECVLRLGRWHCQGAASDGGGVLFYRESCKVRRVRTTTSPAELLSFYPGVNKGPRSVRRTALIAYPGRCPKPLRRLFWKFAPAERDHRNRALGRAGEEFVIDLERRQLGEANRSDLARKVPWMKGTAPETTCFRRPGRRPFCGNNHPKHPSNVQASEAVPGI